MYIYKKKTVGNVARSQFHVMSHFNRVNNARLIRMPDMFFFHPKRPYKYYIYIKTSLRLMGFSVVRAREKTDPGVSKRKPAPKRFRSDTNRLSPRLILEMREMDAATVAAASPSLSFRETGSSSPGRRERKKSEREIRTAIPIVLRFARRDRLP